MGDAKATAADGPASDPPVTIDDADILSVEQALDGLLDKVQADLGFPYSTESNPPPPSTTLSYRLNASIEVSLDTEWPLFDGFTLTNITLKAQMDKFKNSPASLYIQLSASATIGDLDFTVTGTIPRLSTEGPISFALILKVEGALNSLDPTTLLTDLTNGGYVFNSATAKLGPELASQIEDENSGTSFATSALLVVQKPVTGSFFLERVEIDFASDLNWPIIQDRVELSEVSLGLILEHTLAADPWNATLDINAVATIDDVNLKVAGQVSLGDVSSIDLRIRAGTRSGIAPEDALNKFVGAGTDAQVDSQFELPPTATLPDDDQDPFEASLELQKDASGWYLQGANARLFWQAEFWYPIEGIDISLQKMYFEFIAQREAPLANQTPSSMPLAFNAAFGGSITLYNLLMAVVVTYQSKTSTTTLTCTINDNSNISLQDIAADSLLNPAPAPSKTPTYHDLNQEASTNPVPDSVPVDMSWCSSRIWGTQRFCILTFTASELTQLQLKANFELNWQVTSQLTVTGMGVYFDITNPTSSDKPSVIKGYAYGSVLIANAVNLFAFVAGVSQPSGPRQFALGLTLSYDPNASLGTSPQSIISDPKFLGDVVATDLWTFPTSAPDTANVSDAVTSVNAQMTMRLQQSADPDAATNYLTSIVSMQASLAITGQWTIFDTITLQQLTLNVVVLPGTAATQNKISYYAQLLGVVSPTQTAVGSTQYKVVLAAMLLRNAKEQTTTFTASISAYYIGQADADVPLSAFLQMPLIGINPTDVENDPSAQTVPSELSLQASTLLATPAAQCSLLVQQTNNIWSLKELDASISQATPWTIVPDKLTVTNSTLNLRIKDPKLSTRQIQFSASTSVTIGTLAVVNASISVSQGVNGQEDSVTVVLQAANFQQVVAQLAGSPVTIPPDCPILTDNQYSATVTIICKKLEPTDTGFALASIGVRVSASNVTTWTLGPLSVTDLTLTAAFDYTTDPSTSTLSLNGRTRISGLNSPVDVLITLTNLQTLIIAISTPLEPTQLVGTFVPGGLDSPSLQAPDITSASGLDGYRDAAGVNASITFMRDTSWYADNLSLDVASGTQQWSLVDSYIWAKDLKLTVALKNMHTQSQLSVILSINFWFTLRPPQTGSDKLSCSLEATSKELTGIVDTSKCDLAQFLYVATAGFWNPPDLLSIKLIKTLTLTMSWNDGTGNFTATCFDWILTETLPKLAKMENPRLVVNLTKNGSRFEAAGQIAGTAYMLAVPVDLSYDLVSGPFRIFEIDVKDAYKLAQRLYKLLKNVKELAEVAEEIAATMAELAELAGIAEIAGDIFAGLTALGAAKDIVQGALDKVFGKDNNNSSKGPSNDQDDPSSNDSSNGSSNGGSPHLAKPSLVVGGTLMSPGPGGQEVKLVVYPKDKFGNFLQPFDSSQLRLNILLPDVPWENLAIIWSAIPNGVQTSLPRPSSEAQIGVKYSGLEPPIETDFHNTIQAQPSVFSLANSDVAYPQTIGCLSQGLIVLTPKDQYGQPRLGEGAAPPLALTFVNQASGTAPSYDASKGFVVRNDSLLLPFSVKAVGTYHLTIQDPSDAQSQPRNFVITAVDSLSPENCIAYGEGLCSGLGSEQVALYVKLRDQNGDPYTPGPNENPDITITLSLPIPTVPDISIPFSITKDLLTAFYLRPAAGSYQILISINDVLLGEGSFDLLVQTAAVAPSITKSTFSVRSVSQAHMQPSGLIAQGDQLQGLITTYDGQGQRWYQSLINDSYHVVWPSVFTPGPLVDNSNGTYSMSAVASAIDPSTGMSLSVSSTANPLLECVDSPRPMVVSPPRQLSTLIAYGSGLEEGHDQTSTISLRGFDQYHIDFPVVLQFVPAVLGTNCRLRLLQDDVPWTYSSPTAFSHTASYQMPALGSKPFLVLLSPFISTGQVETTFKPELFLVPCGTPYVTDPTKCFVVWKKLVQDDISSATLYACDNGGNRRRQGGDFVQTSSTANTPMILTTSINDNLDGSYTIDMMMPAAAFASQTPAPTLVISVNGQPIQATPFSFPLSPLPMVYSKADGPGLTTAILGKEANFSISCFASNGQLSSAGFHGASVYLVQNTDIPRYVVCEISANNTGTAQVTYTIPADMGAGTYECYIYVNSEQIAQSPTTVNVVADSSDYFSQAYRICRYIFASPPERWSIVADQTLWKIDTSQDGITTLTTQAGASGLATVPVTFALNLPVVDQWFQNGGFMFSYDITIDSGSPIQIAPFTQPTNQVTMTWINGPNSENNVPDNTQSTIEWQVGGTSIVVPRPERLHITPTDAATICYHYMISEDNSQYLLYVFQAGQFVTQGSWPRTANPATLLPTLGLQIQCLAGTGCKIGVSNVLTIPTYFRTKQKLIAVADSFQNGNKPSNAVDGNPNTFWHSEFSPTLVPLPHNIVVDLNSLYLVSGLTYQPRQDGSANGNIGNYSIQLSLNGQNWDAPCATGAFADDSSSKTLTFTSQSARYVRLNAMTEAGNRGPWSSAADIIISYANPETGADVILSEPWASKYVLTVPNSGHLSSSGLIVDGTQTGQSNCWIYQNPVPEYGCSIAIYSLSVLNAFEHPVTKPGEPPMIAAIGFQGPFWCPQSGRWVNWGNTIEDIGPSNMKLDDSAVNTVMVVTGKSCVTIFCNGVFQFSATTALGQPISSLSPPQLMSYRTNIQWFALRVNPPLRIP